MVRVSETFLDEIVTLAKDGSTEVDCSGARLINASDPIDGSDLATKDYVDGYAGGGTDELVAVSANDTTPGRLIDKITGLGVRVEEQNDGGNETLRLSAGGGTRISAVTPTTISAVAGINEVTYVGVNTAFAGWNDLDTITLPASPVAGGRYIIYDEDNNAGTKRITVSTNGGLFEGLASSTLVIDRDLGFVDVLCTSAVSKRYHVLNDGRSETATPTWESVLAQGAISGATSPQISSGQKLLGVAELTLEAASGTTGSKVEILSGSGTSGNSGDIDINTALSSSGFTGSITIGTGDAQGGSGSGDITIQTGSGDAGTGGDISILAGGNGNSDSGNVIITAGIGGGGNAGDVLITAGSDSSGSVGGVVTITTGDGTASAGGDFTVNCGDGDTDIGGSISLNAGTTSTNDGGNVSLTAGDTPNGSTSSTGGNVNISAGNNTNWNASSSARSGTITLSAGSVTNGNFFNSGRGGDIEIDAGSSYGFGEGGDVNINSGDGGADGTGGSMTLTTGAGGASSGDGGDFSIQAGNAGSSNDGGSVSIVAGSGSNGGDTTISAGGTGTSFAGDLNLNSGSATGAGGAGNINISGGTSTASGGSRGGDVLITGGDTNVGLAGSVELKPGTTSGIDFGQVILKDSNDVDRVVISARASAPATTTIYGDGYVDGNFGISGKLTVDGLIDPTGLVLDHQSSVPGGDPAAGKSTLWVRDTDGYAILTDENGIETILSGGSGGGGGSQTLEQTLLLDNTTGDNDIELSGTGTIITSDSTGTVKDIDLVAGASTDGNSGGGINLTTGTSTGGGGAGSSMTLEGGASSSSGSVSIDAGNAQTGTTSGGNVEFFGGQGGNTVGNGGGIGAYAGNVASGGSGTGGWVDIYAGSGGSGGGDGGYLDLYAGDGSGGGDGGNVSIYGGSGANTGVINLGTNGGTNILAVYDNTTNSGLLFDSSTSAPLISQTSVASNAADMSIQAQSSTSGDGGDLVLGSGDATGTAGNVLINGGTTNGEIHFQTNAGSNLLARVWGDFSGFDTANIQFYEDFDDVYLGVYNGAARSGNPGANLYVQSGYGDSRGGDLYLIAVDALNASSTNGGDVTLQSGEGGDSGGNGGAVNITARGAPAGTGGSITITPGSGGTAAGSVTVATDAEDVIVVGSENTHAAFEVQTDGYFYQNLEVGNKLTVGGLIDPTGLVLDRQSTVPGGTPAAGKVTLWVRDSDGYVIATDESDVDLVLSGGSGGSDTPTLAQVLAEGADANNLNITSLADPVDPQDAATKAYIDGYSFPEQSLAEVMVIGNTTGDDLVISGGDIVGGTSTLNVLGQDDGGAIRIIGGSVTGTNAAGAVVIESGSVDGGSGDAGDGIRLRTPSGNGPSANIELQTTGGATGSGAINITTGDSGGSCGNITLTGGDGSSTGGHIIFNAGSSGTISAKINDASAFDVLNDGDGYFWNNLEVIGNITVSDPVNPDHAATKSYVDGYAFPDTTPTLAEVLAEDNSAENDNITNLADPVDDQDAATKAWVEAQIAAISVSGSGGSTKFVHENIPVTTGGQTDFDLTYVPSDGYDGYSVLMFVNQLKIELDEYSVDGSSVTYAGPLSLQPGTHDVEFYYPVDLDSKPTFVNILSGVATNDGYGWQVIGAVEIDPSDYEFSTATFEAILSSTDGYADGYFVAQTRLYNVTTASAVSSVLDVDGAQSTLVSESITLDSGSNIYEVQLRLSEDGGDTDFATCAMARVRLE